MDKISIKNLEIFAYHGVNPEEKENGQTFFLDIDYYLDLSKACLSDDLEDTVSYAKVVKMAIKTFTEAKYDLIEKVAQRVADEILANFDKIMRVDITLKKPEAPVKAKFDYMAVSISRERN